jgi:hypothetical protein
MLKFLHIFIALNVLFSTSGITVFEHLCEMNGKTIGLYIKPTECCTMEKKANTDCPPKNCCHKKNAQQGFAFVKKSCCENKFQQFKSNISGTSLVHIATSEFEIPIFDDFFPNVPYFYTSIGEMPRSQKILRFYLYKPPPLVRDIPVFVQSFLC